MSSRLYVGNLPFATDEDALRDLFSQAGEVEAVNIIMDSYNGRSKGFGFVEMASEDDARAAIDKFHGMDLQGRPLRVDHARPRESRAAVASQG